MSRRLALPKPGASAAERRRVHRELLRLAPEAEGDVRAMQGLAVAVRRSIEVLLEDIARERAAAPPPDLFEVPVVRWLVGEVGAAVRAVNPEVWERAKAEMATESGRPVPEGL